jgi:hypothetical protein
MKAGGGMTYIYDGRGNRVEKSGTKLYLPICSPSIRWNHIFADIWGVFTDA